jgi:hypothetical protein
MGEPSFSRWLRRQARQVAYLQMPALANHVVAGTATLYRYEYGVQSCVGEP